MSNISVNVQEEWIGGVKTRIIYKKGSPQMPLVLYHPGIFGRPLKNLCSQNIPQIALQSGCSFLAVNTIDQDSSGEYPPRNIDFDQCLEIINEALTLKDTTNGVIPILNSWGALPLTMALQQRKDIEVKGVLGISATLNAHNKIREGITQYFNHGFLSQQDERSFHAGRIISAPYPSPDSKNIVHINKGFFETIDQVDTPSFSIPVKGKVILLHGQQDNLVTVADTRQLTTAFISQTRQDTEIRLIDDGHWDNREPHVQEALTQIIRAVQPPRIA